MSKTLKARYDELAMKRESFLKRARRYASLTIPALLPPIGFHYTSDLPEPSQNLGSRLVTNLSSRLLTALLPPGGSSFRLGVPTKQLLKAGAMSAPVEVERGLVLSEKLINGEIEAKNWRQSTSISLQLLIVTGNALEQMMPDNSIRVFRLDQYVVVRDYSGNVLEVIIEERLPRDSLPETARSIAKPSNDPKEDVRLYTCYKRESGGFMAWQEIDETEVPNSRGTYTVLPVNPLRWQVVPGEDYGRSKVEEHIGDLVTLEAHSTNMREGGAMAARHLTFVRPNAAGGNLRQRIAKAKNGDVLAANPEDVSAFNYANVTGLQVIQTEVERATMSLSAAFLMMGDLRRDAERVTATELRMLAEELEGALGGVYSLLSSEMQLARLRRLILQMQNQGELPQWGFDGVDVKITTGLEALGREQDVSRVMQAAQIAAAFGETAMMYVKFEELLATGFNGLGLANAVRTQDEVMQMQQQVAMAQATAQGVGQQIAKGGE